MRTIKEVEDELDRVRNVISGLSPYPIMANDLNVPIGYEIVNLNRLKAVMDEGTNG